MRKPNMRETRYRCVAYYMAEAHEGEWTDEAWERGAWTTLESARTAAELQRGEKGPPYDDVWVESQTVTYSMPKRIETYA